VCVCVCVCVCIYTYIASVWSSSPLAVCVCVCMHIHIHSVGVVELTSGSGPDSSRISRSVPHGAYCMQRQISRGVDSTCVRTPMSASRPPAQLTGRMHPCSLRLYTLSPSHTLSHRQTHTHSLSDRHSPLTLSPTRLLPNRPMEWARWDCLSPFGWWRGVAACALWAVSAVALGKISRGVESTCAVESRLGSKRGFAITPGKLLTLQ